MPRKRGRPAGSKNGSRSSTNKLVASKVAPKYQDPVSGATWSGRARPPAWIKDVKDRSKFLIEPPAAGASASRSAKRT
ncbi:H-NS family nucleoid-associated regulatory protein [Paraburkholderia bengalensis]